MKILRIVYDWPPPWDGLAPAPFEMTAAQLKLGHKIDVFCGRWPFAGPIEELNNTTFHPFIRELLPGTLNILISPLVFLYYLFWRTRNTPDIIHSHGHFAIWIYWYRAFLKKKYPKSKELQIPLIVHFHNTVKGRWEKLKEQGQTINLVSEKVSWPIALKSDKWAVEVADACIFVSTDTRQDAIKYYEADPAKCFVVETGVNTKLFSPISYEEHAKTREELGFGATDKIILNHGAMVERKNIHLLVEALRFLPTNYKLLLVGPPAPEEYEARISEVVVRYNLSQRIIKAGYTPYPQAPIVHQVADIFVLPSEWEGLPKVVMQSLASGIPALASGFETEKRIAGLIYLKELTPKNIAKQIVEVVNSKTPVDLGFVRTNYSWDVMARKVEQIYNKVLNK